MSLRMVINICFSIGSWMILNGLGAEFNILFPIGLMMFLTGLDIKHNSR